MIDEFARWLWPLIPAFIAGCFFRLSRIAIVVAVAIALPLLGLAAAIALSLSTAATLCGIALMVTFSAGVLVMTGAALGAALRAMSGGTRRLRSETVSASPPAQAKRFALETGHRYRIVDAFTDYDGVTHEAGETWTVLASFFVPHEDGQAWRVSIDAQGERVVRMRWTQDAQAPVLDRLDRYFRAIER
jgi:membrane protein implicated in regulation of membrane protease activity